MRRGRRFVKGMPAGKLAWFDGKCWTCDGPIQFHVHMIVMRKGNWIHTSCAPGQDDE